MWKRIPWLFLAAVVVTVLVSAAVLPVDGTILWIAAFLAPALIVLTIHALVIGTWQRSDRWRVRRRAEAALLAGEPSALRKAAAETAQARRDWPGIDLSAVGGALCIARRRIESGGGQPGPA